MSEFPGMQWDRSNVEHTLELLERNLGNEKTPWGVRVKALAACSYKSTLRAALERLPTDVLPEPLEEAKHRRREFLTAAMQHAQDAPES